MAGQKSEPLTLAQKEQLEGELAELEGPRRIEAVQAIAAARSFGDLSENFEYHAAKNEQGMLERRITLLRNRLARAVLVDEAAAASGTVGVGSRVELEDEHGERMKVEISSVGGVSPDSPVGRALMGRKAGDEVEVLAPSGSWRARVVSVGATVFAAVLLAAAGAGAKVVPQRGIAGVELRESKAQVRARLGSPVRVKSGRNEFGSFTNFIYGRVTVMFQGGSRATALRTSSLYERTARGVGVGSTEAEVKAKVPGVRCRTEFGARNCFLGRFLPGWVVTDFLLRKGRVSSIVVGFVLD
jgi:transcription elongation factor GreA